MISKGIFNFENREKIFGDNNEEFKRVDCSFDGSLKTILNTFIGELPVLHQFNSFETEKFTFEGKEYITIVNMSG